MIWWFSHGEPGFDRQAAYRIHVHRKILSIFQQFKAHRIRVWYIYLHLPTFTYNIDPTGTQVTPFQKKTDMPWEKHIHQPFSHPRPPIGVLLSCGDDDDRAKSMGGPGPGGSKCVSAFGSPQGFTPLDGKTWATKMSSLINFLQLDLLPSLNILNHSHKLCSGGHWLERVST